MSYKKPKCKSIWQRHQWGQKMNDVVCQVCGKIRNPKAKPLDFSKTEREILLESLACPIQLPTEVLGEEKDGASSLR